MFPLSYGAPTPPSATPQPAKIGKPTHRGRKPSTKPGASQLGALQQAHAAGDFKAAKSAALNYANTVHTHLTSQPQAGNGMVNGMTMDDQDTTSDQMPAMSAPPSASPPKVPGNGRAQLAKLAMRRGKKM